MNERSFILISEGFLMQKNATRRGAETRSTIIQTAHDLFIQQGYHGTSMRQIASQAGLALGGLYNHFESKESVFEAVFIEYHPYHQVLPLLLDVQGDSIEQRVRFAAQQMVDVIDRRPDFLNLMFIEVVEFRSAHASQVFNVVLPQGAEVARRIVGDQPDRIRDIPVPMLIRSFLGLFFSYFLTELIFVSAAPQEFIEDAMGHMVDIYLHGVLKEQGEQKT